MVDVFVVVVVGRPLAGRVLALFWMAGGHVFLFLLSFDGLGAFVLVRRYQNPVS